jgi:hypothetical protein
VRVTQLLTMETTRARRAPHGPLSGSVETMKPSTLAVASLSRAVAKYSCRLHEHVGGRHSVTSALGVWLLLALTSDTVADGERGDLVNLLGMPLVDAKNLAATLLDSPHPQVCSATAAWTQASHETPALRRWLETLPNSLNRGPVPSQTEADTWAADNTDGLIDHFPLPISEDTLLVLASALATKVDWYQPFEVASVKSTPGGATSWPSDVTTVLRSPEDVRRYICRSEFSGAGDVAVHEASAEGLVVVSVAAGPHVSQAQVIAAAHKVALAAAAPRTQGAIPLERSLFDLELGRHPCWHLDERECRVTSTTGREERVEAYLPAWQAETDLDLTADRQLGVGSVLTGLSQLLVPDSGGSKGSAQQAAKASFSKTGFTAAAVTAFDLIATGPPPHTRNGVLRTATLLFGGPHAVVAVAIDSPRLDGGAELDGPWHGIPVFSAWVTEAVEA